MGREPGMDGASAEWEGACAVRPLAMADLVLSAPVLAQPLLCLQLLTETCPAPAPRLVLTLHLLLH